ncbi:hypothetical protein GCM10011613_25290 [Cellvibrio zantedeschiae]|uniref:Copper resistance protein D n=1 Tax=Cellvibrio zantedeschiae TaxID=1237077 RepID=A0ABQ3B5I5_9GAMM|nr:CopD family protein [Cellvibrio zantedeschiae]GGY79389.1 hypothetical protein GCM10011613_25290 [Cellvibrio zantedeschiae]
MDAGLWVIPTLVVRVLLYACVAGAMGGCLSSVLLTQHRELSLSIIRYTQGACVLGVVLTLASVSIQAGALAEAGMAGLFNASILSVLMRSAVGTAMMLQLAGFLLIGTSRLGLNRYAIPSNLLAVGGSLLVAASFAQTGHMAEKGLVGQIAVTLHVGAMGLWLGSLYPLWLAARSKDTEATSLAMTRFGEWAVFIVAALLICGITMATLMLGDWHKLFTTAYGKGLLVKFGLVTGLLALAAGNKWLTVPRLAEKGFTVRLAHTIVFEMLLGSAVLITTAIVILVIGSEA